MLRGSPLYCDAVARQTGVGSAMHAYAPGIINTGVPPPGAILLSPSDRDLITKYDRQRFTWERLYAAVTERCNPPTDVSAGSVPWWIWLSNSGSVQNSIEGSVTRVLCDTSAHGPTLVITTTSGTYSIWNNRGRPRLA